MTFRQAGAVVGIDYSYLCKLTKGTRLPSRRVVERLAGVLLLSDDVVEELKAVAPVRPGGGW